ncbi:Phage antirepressor protein [Lactococcus lactis subsp. lactis]|uniref:Phage antirepressor protein n=1 Tax=Lactococcus lactis subsp. lactis TaxID=1360 RepID=A0A0V8CLB5_LACLL|nr:antA/AntB antirepressor family protein [Lactococcus lactis]KSU02099.1 Phage antirepressor protein [Lactococcus lactis subsp. lactis]
MNQLIKITQNENNDQVVSGRELHEFLGIKTRYNDWFEDMVKYGFTENVDFIGFTEKRVKPQGGRPSVDHALKLDMAKEISMIQRNEKGKQARQYFIEVEKKYIKQVQIPKTQRELVQLALSANEETNQRIDVVETKIQEIEENKLITTEDKGTIDSHVRKKVASICREQRLDQQAKSLLFQDLGSSIKRLFNVPNRGRIKDKDFLKALDFIDTWEPSSVTKAQIHQLSLFDETA